MERGGTVVSLYLLFWSTMVSACLGYRPCNGGFDVLHWASEQGLSPRYYSPGSMANVNAATSIVGKNTTILCKDTLHHHTASGRRSSIRSCDGDTALYGMMYCPRMTSEIAELLADG
jgi:hypothetical protein